MTIAPTVAPTAAATIPAASPIWDVPGPDATVPPGVPVIPGLEIEALAGAWESIGLTCESWNVGPPPGDVGFTLHCVRVDAANNVAYLGEAVYFTPTGVNWVSMQVRTANPDAIDATPAAHQMFPPSVELAGGPAVREWVQGRIGDEACLEKCRLVEGWGRLILTIGLRGTHTLYLVADVPS